MNEVIAYLIDGSSATLRYTEKPDTCPVCHQGIQAQHINGAYIRTLGDDHLLQIPFRCPRLNCGTFFIQEYRNVYITGTSYYEPLRRYPSTLKKPSFLEEVASASTNYVKTYTQALQAEVNGLDEIAGIGFRKSLEFLIKDYCISKDPTKTETIKAKWLAKCIKDDVTDENIQACAEMAVWLGNDETHYERTWTDHDVRDLKALIKLTENWISREIQTRKYRAQIQKGKEPGNTAPPSPKAA